MDIFSKSKNSSNPYLSDPDVCLMLEVKKGNNEAFETLMRKYYPALLNFIYRFLGNRESAEDLTQEVFIRVYKAAPKYLPKATFKTWVYLIARRLSLNECRRRQRKFNVSLDKPFRSGGEELPWQIEDKTYPRPDEAFLKKEKSRLIKVAIASLPVKQRMAVILRAYNNFSYQEIAQILKVSIKAVKSLLSRARKTLKKRLPGLLDE